MTRESLGETFKMPRPVLIVEHDSRWPTFFEDEKRRILAAIGHKVVAIEHIGSTAVSGLGGKPIIDIMAGVYQSTDADECIPLLEDLDYEDVTAQPEEPDWYYCLSKACRTESPKLKNYHLHLVRFKSDHWRKHLLFRDFLQTHRKAAKEYYQLKKSWAANYGSDREGYTEAKTSFVESIVSKAKKHRTTWKRS